MKVIKDLKSETINELAEKLANDALQVDTDDSTSYVD